MHKFSTEAKVGLFAAALLVVLAWATLRVSDKAAVGGRGYELSFVVDSASGLKPKAPVELAGVDIGVVKEITIVDSRLAKVTITLNSRVQLPDDSKTILRTRGFLGETYVEILPGTAGREMVKANGMLTDASRTGDVNDVVSDFSVVAQDIKEFARALKEVTLRNTDNIDTIAANMAELTKEIRDMVEQSRENVERSFDQIASITRKIDRGEGTVGKLVNDDETVQKLNDSLDGLSETLGGYRRLEAEVGFHTEYLSNSGDFKNYVSLALKPTPDKAVLLGIVSDPDPNPARVQKTTDVTVGGTTTTVTTNTATVDRSKLRISAQLAKSFYDFQIRGGLIESTGGMGVDYSKGPVGVQFSAFDFSTRFGQRPHLKVLGDVDVTKNFFFVGGADDMINPMQKTDYFIGAGFKFVDDDFKKLAIFSGGSSSLLGK